jgi:hypothetical protein
MVNGRSNKKPSGRESSMTSPKLTKCGNEEEQLKETMLPQQQL